MKILVQCLYHRLLTLHPATELVYWLMTSVYVQKTCLGMLVLDQSAMTSQPSVSLS